MNNELSIKKIVILGGGSAGWMTAAMLANQLRGNCEITLIESSDIPTVGVGEATIPPIKVFNNILGISENDFLSRCNGSIKLGIQFENWKQDNHNYFHHFGKLGADFDYMPFPYFWLKSIDEGNLKGIQEYSAAWHMAKKNKFTNNFKTSQLMSGMDYAYHFDAGLYAKFLKEYSLKLGVFHIDAKFTQANISSETGFINELVLDSEQVVEGDFFIDCTGTRSLLLGDSLNVNFEDWSEHLLCDSAIAMQTTHSASISPYTRSIAHGAGWQWRIPLQSRMGNGNVYSSQFMNKDEAVKLLEQSVDGKPLTEPKQVKFTPGRRDKFWHKNCLAIGLSAGFLEPLESTSLHLIQRGIMRLISLFPDKRCLESNVNAYNKETIDEYEHIRDFIILHYKATERNDTEFWQYCQNMEVPDTLQERMELFENTGHIVTKDKELFKQESWIAVLTGQGIHPKSLPPIMSYKTQIDSLKTLNQMESELNKVSSSFVSHEMYLAQNCRYKATN